jgi:hypothetical protein
MSYQTKPAVRSADITPSDTEAILATRGIIVGSDGSLVVQMESGNDQTFPVIKAGVIYPFSITKVYTASTATGVIALW